MLFEELMMKQAFEVMENSDHNFQFNRIFSAFDQ